ncbi:SH3 domain-containing protein [Sunxiuqinia elliptica]
MKGVISLFLILLFTSLSLSATNYTVTANQLNVRRYPSAESISLGMLEKGDTILALLGNPEWTKIEYKDQHAYVSSKYLKKVEVPVIKEKTKENSKTSNANTPSIILWIVTVVFSTFFVRKAQTAGEKRWDRSSVRKHAILTIIVYSGIFYVFFNYFSSISSHLLSVESYVKYLNILCLQIILLVAFYNLIALRKIMNYNSWKESKATFSIIATISVVILSYVFVLIFIDSHPKLARGFIVGSPIFLAAGLIIQIMGNEIHGANKYTLPIAFVINAVSLFAVGLASSLIAGIEFTLPTFLLVLLYHYNLLKVPSSKRLKKIVSKPDQEAIEREREAAMLDTAIDNMIQEEMERLDAKIAASEAMDESDNELIEEESIENEDVIDISDLHKEEKALYLAYVNLIQSVNQVCSVLSIKPLQLLLTPDQLRPRFKPATGELIKSELPKIWKVLVQRYPVQLEGVKHDANDDVFLGIVEETQHETLQHALCYYVETLIELEACELAIEKNAPEKSKQGSIQKQPTTKQKPKSQPVARPKIQKGIKARREIISEGDVKHIGFRLLTYRNGVWIDENGAPWKEYASGRFRPLRKFMIHN